MPAFINPQKAKSATEKVLKDMEMHTTISLGRVHILRVLAGWIYYSSDEGKVSAAVFVPQKN